MNREFLYELLETASVSGFEEEIQRKVIKYARGFADEVYTDEIADVVSIVNPDAKIKVMLSAHMDEIGLMVSHITEKGMLHVSKAGGIYPGTYLGQKVRIMHEGNVVYGAVRNHGSLNKKELEITDIIIDIGAVSREDAMCLTICKNRLCPCFSNSGQCHQLFLSCPVDIYPVIQKGIFFLQFFFHLPGFLLGIDPDLLTIC